MYTPTPINYYDDYIQHGWLKDQAAKVHKYLERWRGKNGKWYYRYKSKAQELGTKIRRKINGIPANKISINKGRETVWGYSRDTGKSGGTRGIYKDGYGRISSQSFINDRTRVNAGIEAGRKRAAKAANKKKKQETAKRFSEYMTRKTFSELDKKHEADLRKSKKNVRQRGYSSSRGSVTNNKATNGSLRGRANREWLKSQSPLKKYTYNPRNHKEILTRETQQKKKK